MSKETLFDTTSSDRKVIIERLIDAPRDMVYRAITDNDLIPEWWGPEVLKTTVDKMEVKPGGEWRYIQRDASGQEYAFHGVYNTVVPNERLVYSFVFEGSPNDILVESVTLTDEAGKTRLHIVDAFENAAKRDEALKTGMKEGALEAMDRFIRLVESAPVRQ